MFTEDQAFKILQSVLRAESHGVQAAIQPHRQSLPHQLHQQTNQPALQLTRSHTKRHRSSRPREWSGRWQLQKPLCTRRDGVDAIDGMKISLSRLIFTTSGPGTSTAAPIEFFFASLIAYFRVRASIYRAEYFRGLMQMPPLAPP
jgi:hypothetical protein